MIKGATYSVLCAVLVSAILSVASLAVAASDTDFALKGLKGAPLLQFPTAGASCYGLDPLAPELRANDAAIKDLASAGFNFPLPKSENGSTTTLGTVRGAYIKISDSLVKMNEVNCLDKVQIALMYPASVKLEHNGQMYASYVQLWAMENIIIGSGKEDYLGRRQAAIAQMFGLLAAEWKRQNAN